MKTQGGVIQNRLKKSLSLVEEESILNTSKQFEKSDPEKRELQRILEISDSSFKLPNCDFATRLESLILLGHP